MFPDSFDRFDCHGANSWFSSMHRSPTSGDLKHQTHSVPGTYGWRHNAVHRRPAHDQSTVRPKGVG
jgi:hypothetical protein